MNTKFGPPVRPSMWHHLKCWPEYFAAVLRGDKPFEVRKHDRDFRPCDYLTLEEWDPATEQYTGRIVTRLVISFFDDSLPGVEPGYCVMGTRKV